MANVPVLPGGSLIAFHAIGMISKTGGSDKYNPRHCLHSAEEQQPLETEWTACSKSAIGAEVDSKTPLKWRQHLHC